MDGFLHTLLASFIALEALCAGRSDRSHENHGFQTPSMDRHCVCGIYPQHPASPHHIRFYFGLPNAGLRLDGFQAGTIALTIYTSAFIAEAIRAGIQTVSKGQMEAARSSGFTYSQAMRYVILPQAVKIVSSPLGEANFSDLSSEKLINTRSGGGTRFDVSGGSRFLKHSCRV